MKADAQKAALSTTEVRCSTKKSINKVSDKQKKINALYKILRDQFMKDKPMCQAGWEGCTHYSTECHHSKGRVGFNMLDSSTYRSLCKNCHDKVGEQSDRAKELNLSASRLATQ